MAVATVEVRSMSSDSLPPVAMTTISPHPPSSSVVKNPDKKKPPPLEMGVVTTEPKTPRDREKKKGHRRVNENTGQVTYKKKATSDLQTAIQLGIGQSVGSLTQKPERDVLMQDFSVVETVGFPEDGSKITPAHRVGDFKFKTYAPFAFRYFRELFDIRPDDFLASLCIETLQELSNPGASGSVFFLTEDDEFIIKTVQHKEAHFLQKLLPGYYMNLNQNPRTLLPKFYGLYCHMQSGKNIRIAIMNNLLPSSVKMHEKYDLKGSTHKRKASRKELAKASPTLKDLDFIERHPEGIQLEQETYEALLKTIKVDCRVLESFKIMDYSFLLGIHNLDVSRRERAQNAAKRSAPSQSPTTAFAFAGAVGGATAAAPPSPSTSPTLGAASSSSHSAGPSSSSEGAAGPACQGAEGGLTRSRSVKQRLANFSTAMESIQAEAEPVNLDDEDVPPGGIPARNDKGERLLLYVGIIDILQSYRFKKKLEHGFKSIISDGETISVTRPSFYAQRFQDFFHKTVFRKISSSVRSPSKRKVSRPKSLSDTLEARVLHDGMMSPAGVSRKPDLLSDHHVPSATSASPSRSMDGAGPQVAGGILVHRSGNMSPALVEPRDRLTERAPAEDEEGPPPYTKDSAGSPTAGPSSAAGRLAEPHQDASATSSSSSDEEERSGASAPDEFNADALTAEELGAEGGVGVVTTTALTANYSIKKSVRFTSESAGALTGPAAMAKNNGVAVTTVEGRAVGVSLSEGRTPVGVGVTLKEEPRAHGDGAESSAPSGAEGGVELSAEGGAEVQVERSGKGVEESSSGESEQTYL